MKRREIKFVAGSLPLAPDRIGHSLRKPPAGRRKAVGQARTKATTERVSTPTRKRR
jgi:hypothetical protein